MTMRAELQRVGSDGQSAPFADDDSAGQRWPRRRGCSGAIGQGLRLAAFWRPGRGIRRRGWRRPSADSARERRRWLLAGGAPLSPRNAWALIGLASGDQPFSECCPGLLERAEELSRTRARLTRGETWSSWLRLRRRATLIVRQLPESLRGTLEHKAALVRTGPVPQPPTAGTNSATATVRTGASMHIFTGGVVQPAGPAQSAGH